MRLFQKKKTAPSPKVQVFITTAAKYLGYQSEVLGRNRFGAATGYDAAQWGGAFIDVVAREAGVRLPSFTYSPAGLAESVRSGNISRIPRPGDIAIFNFSTSSGPNASPFAAPHCGVVTDVREVLTKGRFVTIEGNTTGAGSYQDKDGVHQKMRHLTDVVLFCRPEEFQDAAAGSIRQLLIKLIQKLARVAPSRVEIQAIEEAIKNPKEVRIGMLRSNTRNRHIEIVQLALSQVAEITGAEQGQWDPATAAACARFQRNIGRTGADVTGKPDIGTLLRLSKETGLFTVKESS
jgi:hypothetical protein